MSVTPRRNQAAWELVARDVTGDTDVAVRTLAQAAAATGLSMETINDCLYRSIVTGPANPRTHLCRPAYRRGSVPLWSPEQVALAVPLATSRRRRVGHGKGPRKPLVADGADVVGVRDIVAAVGCHEQTVRKWIAGTHSASSVAVDAPRPFPEASGRRAQPPGRHAGNPETVYDRAQVHAWLRDMLGLDNDALATPSAAAAVYRERIAAAS